MRRSNSTRLRELLDQAAALPIELPGLVHTWRFAIGAVYALCQSDQFSQQASRIDRSVQEYIGDMSNVIRAIRTKSTPPEDWMRAFYYNASVMRVDGLYERLLRALLNEPKNDNAEKLYCKAHGKFPSFFPKPYEESLFHRVREEANALKHEIGGAGPSLREGATILTDALVHWFAIVSDGQVNNELRSRYGPRSRPARGREKKNIRSNLRNRVIIT